MCRLLVVAICLLFASTVAAQEPPLPTNGVSLAEEVVAKSDFDQFLDRLDAAIMQFLNGDDAAFKRAWSHAEDITVAGGFGGEVVQGWETLGPRLSRVSESYTDTMYSTERIARRAFGDFGYLVQHEYFHRPGDDAPYQQYRVTMLFRLESGKWKLFHRHADSQVVFQARD